MEAKVEAIASNGRGLFRHEGRAVFVPWTVPGDQILWQPQRQRDRLIEGVLEQVVNPSSDRVTPPCPWFGECGGCQLQMASASAQNLAKSQWIYDAFTRIGRIRLQEKPAVWSGQPYEYRRRIALRSGSRDGRIAFGYAQAGDVSRFCFPTACLLLNEHPILAEINTLLSQSSLAVIEGARAWIYAEEGRFSLWIRTPRESQALFHALCPLLEQPHWSALAVEEGESVLQRGSWDLRESIEGIPFRLSPRAFLQGHRALSRRLWQEVVSWACQESGPLLDLYSGMGVTGILCARSGLDVTMVEADPALTRSAVDTLREQGLAAKVLTARVETALPSFPSRTCHTLLLNPPRAGCSPEACQQIQRLSPARISYVSCHPASCARDLQRLSGYRLCSLVGIDLFPQTAHVECWVTLEREE